MGKEKMYYEQLGYDFDPPFYRAEDKPVATNADRIRAMTDEELAEYLYSRGNDSEYCYGICAFQDECKEWKSREFCIEHIVEWLRQEAKDD